MAGRQEGKLNDIMQDCVELIVRNGFEDRMLGVRADFLNLNEMVKVPKTLEKGWSGLDTLIVAAGVSSLRPLFVRCWR